MNKEELKHLVNTIKNQESIFKKKHIELYDYIVKNIIGNSFIEKLHNIKNDIFQIPKCGNIECNNDVSFNDTYRRYKKYCCKDCELLGISKIKKNYDKDKKELIQNKRKNTCLDKYGIESAQKSDIVKDKATKTFIDKYGVKSPTLNKDIIEKRAKNNKEKWGVEYLTQLPEHIEKIKYKRKNTINKQIIEKYKSLGVNMISFKDSISTCICDKCNKEYTISHYIIYQRLKAYLNPCILCNPLGDSNESQFQKSISNYLIELGINIETSNRTILDGKELDIYIPEYKIAIEANGTYWHNELYKSKSYHRNKYLKCKEKGIQLIQIWQDDWLYKNDIVKSRLLSKFKRTKKIGARKCIIKKVEYKKVKLFLDENHLQSYVPSKLNYGLFYNNELVSIMTFTKSRISIGNKNSYELLRFCNKLNHTIIGGADKLFKKFIKDENVDEIVSYANLEWGEGDYYSKLGFKRLNDTSIGYSYIENGIKRHRFNYRKDILIKQGYDKNKSEHEIMLDRKIYRVYNTANAIWKWNKKEL